MEYRTKEDYVADFLREGIISGQFTRGQRLKQTEIAETLKLSITPVREALKLLEAEGYLVRESHHGVTVSSFDKTGAADVLGLRVQMEDRLMRAAVPRMTKQDIAELKILQNSFEAAVTKADMIEVRRINYRLHRLVYLRAELPQTFHFVQVLWAKYPFDLVNSVKGRAKRAIQEHRILLRAIAKGDVEGSALAIKQHIQEGWEELRISLPEIKAL